MSEDDKPQNLKSKKTMKNYCIIGASTGIGQALVQQLQQEDCQLYGTYCKTPVESTSNQVTYHHLNVLDENLDLSFLDFLLPR